MKNFRYLLYPTLLLFFASPFFPSCKSAKSAQTAISGTYRAAFYNVENLFDTIDIPNKFDDEFSPNGNKKWNTERYYDKLNKLSKVVDGMNYPSILGLCEIENEAVLKDFVSETSLKGYNYQIVHFESPDERGIDNALIYNQTQFEVITSKNISIDFPKDIAENDLTRDILYVKGKLAGNVIIHVFVNHWPSRRGGVKESEPKRTYVASVLRKAVDEIFGESPKANILILGDLNDEPNKTSVMETLGAKTSLIKIEEKSLYNCMAELSKNGKGTYQYKGDWNMIDNIIVSSSLMNSASKIQVTNATVFQADWMMYNDPKYGKVPSKSYGGPNYYGGYSDHLPVFVDILVK